MVDPVLYLAFESQEDAIKASKQHICLCRNEDVLLPHGIHVRAKQQFQDVHPPKGGHCRQRAVFVPLAGRHAPFQNPGNLPVHSVEAKTGKILSGLPKQFQFISPVKQIGVICGADRYQTRLVPL